MKRIFLVVFLFFSFIVVHAESNLTYSIILDYENGKIQISNILLVQSQSIITPVKNGEYEATLLSFDKQKLFSTNFDFDLNLAREPSSDWFDKNGKQIIVPKQDRDLQVTKTQKTLFLPYFRNAEKIEIKHLNEIALIGYLSKYAGCNMNDLCEPNKNESFKTCSEDCPTGSADGYCDGTSDNKCDPDCIMVDDIDCKQSLGQTTEPGYFWIGIGFVIIIIALILVVIMYVIRRKSKIGN